MSVYLPFGDPINFLNPFVSFESFLTSRVFQPAEPTVQNATRPAIDPVVVSAALPATQPTARPSADSTTQSANPSSISPLVGDWDTEVIQPVSLRDMCKNHKDDKGDEFNCGICSSYFDTLYLFLSHKSEKCRPPVMVRQKEKLFQKCKKAKSRRHTGALVSGKLLTSSPVIQSLVNFSQQSRKKNARVCCVCHQSAPPVSSQGDAEVAWVACDECEHFAHAFICVPAVTDINSIFSCPCHSESQRHADKGIHRMQTVPLVFFCSDLILFQLN